MVFTILLSFLVFQNQIWSTELENLVGQARESDRTGSPDVAICPCREHGDPSVAQPRGWDSVAVGMGSRIDAQHTPTASCRCDIGGRHNLLLELTVGLQGGVRVAVLRVLFLGRTGSARLSVFRSVGERCVSIRCHLEKRRETRTKLS